MRIARNVFIFCALALSLGLVSCEKDDKVDPNLPALQVSISGTINHTNYTPGQEGTITFNRFPASVDEFKQVQEQIGREPHGAVALELMAAEMFRRNASRGTESFRLCNTPNNVDIQTTRWKELFSKDAYYARPYQVAAFLRGATQANNYTPQEPYTIVVKVNGGRPYQDYLEYQSTVLYLDVMSQGHDAGSQTVYVVKPNPCRLYPNGSPYFLVDNCPGLYTQVKEIYEPGWNKLK